MTRRLRASSPDHPPGDLTAPLSPGSVPTGAAPIGAIVRVLDAPAIPATFALESGSMIIGSGKTSDIVVNAPTISRAHVELALVPEGVSVVDLGSRNGTFYQGQRVERMVLPLGGRIKVAAVTVAIDVDKEWLAEAPGYSGGTYRGIVGASEAMRRLFAMLARLEGSLATVLVEGESGSGKELVARALHDGSAVASGPFVALNCGAMPREFIASELFGHRRGAFTGAVEARRGAFESADGGTLFLDEVGELPLELQPLLLRALELGEIRALGDDQSRRVKVRLLAATNRDLASDVRAGRFRQDLFYRLAVVRLTVPPLRERAEDIEPLARYFASLAGIGLLADDVVAQLKARDWPGNVRELQNAIHAYVALGVVPGEPRDRANALRQNFLELIDVDRPYVDQKDAIVDFFTSVYLSELMARAGGNQSEAARLSGLSRGYLGRLLVKYGLARAGTEADDE